MSDKKHNKEKPIDKKLTLEEQQEKDAKERLAQKYEQIAHSKASGIFKLKKRQQLLGLFMPKKKKSEQEEKQAEATFWYRTRNQVRTSLLDFELFIETGKDNVNEVITAETLSPIVEALLRVKVWNPEPEKALIAQLFISKGLQYLRNYPNVSHRLAIARTLDEALDLTNLIVENFKGEKKVEDKSS